jgi:hypothetical protein
MKLSEIVIGTGKEIPFFSVFNFSHSRHCILVFFISQNVETEPLRIENDNRFTTLCMPLENVLMETYKMLAPKFENNTFSCRA